MAEPGPSSGVRDRLHTPGAGRRHRPATGARPRPHALADQAPCAPARVGTAPSWRLRSPHRPPTWLQRAWAGVLFSAPAALSHESALVAAEGRWRAQPPDSTIHVAIDRDRHLVPPSVFCCIARPASTAGWSGASTRPGSDTTMLCSMLPPRQRATWTPSPSSRTPAGLTDNAGQAPRHTRRARPHRQAELAARRPHRRGQRHLLGARARLSHEGRTSARTPTRAPTGVGSG